MLQDRMFISPSVALHGSQQPGTALLQFGSPNLPPAEHFLNAMLTRQPVPLKSINPWSPNEAVELQSTGDLRP